MTTDFESFEGVVKAVYEHPTNTNMRHGQVYFKLLSEQRPAIAELIRGTMFDPFYKDEIHPRTSEIVERYWNHFDYEVPKGLLDIAE